MVYSFAMSTDLRTVQKLLKILGGGPRLPILATLKRRRNASVSEVARLIHRSLNTTSLHLSSLEAAGIIERRRRGHFVFYRLSTVQRPLVQQVLRGL